MNDRLWIPETLQQSDVSDGARLRDVFLPLERHALLDSMIESLLGEYSVIVMRGATEVGKSTLIVALDQECARRRLPTVRPDSAQIEPLALQCLLVEAFGGLRGDAADPLALAKAAEASAWMERPVVLLLDDAPQCSTAVLRYVSLIVQLLNASRTRLCVVLSGGLSGWDFLNEPHLAALRNRAFNVVIPTLSPSDAEDYLQVRLQTGGIASRQEFALARARLTEADGVPGRINTLADELLSRRPEAASAAARPRIGRSRAVASKRYAAAVVAVMAIGAGVFQFLPTDRHPSSNALGVSRSVAAHSQRQAVVETLALRQQSPPANAASPPPQPEAVPAVRVASANPIEVRENPVAPLSEAPAQPQPPSAIVVAEPDVRSAASVAASPVEPPKPTPPVTVAMAAPPVVRDDPAPPPKADAQPLRVATADMPPRSSSAVESAGQAGGPGFALLARSGDTMPSLYKRIYKGVTPPPYEQVVALNQMPVKPGSVVVFPTPPAGWNPHHP